MENEIKPILESEIRSQGLELYTQYIECFEKIAKNPKIKTLYLERFDKLLSDQLNNQPPSRIIVENTNPSDLVEKSKEILISLIIALISAKSSELSNIKAIFPKNNQKDNIENENIKLDQIIDNILSYVQNYAFTSPYDTVGILFELCLREKSKTKFGQYYTSGEIIDFILNWTIKPTTETILDPACGTGPFLIRSLFYKQYINSIFAKNQSNSLVKIGGFEISPNEAHLTQLNLQARLGKSDLIRVLCSDFFNIHPEQKINSEKEISLVDAIIGNPPYTRHESINESTEKDNLIKKIFPKNTNAALSSISKRAGIYSYFILHAWNFLKEGGRLGFIIPNSWLDTEYGKDLQLFLLNHFKIITIIDSKIERWFRGADINTVILILEKCANNNSRDANLVHFLQLKKTILTFCKPIRLNIQNEPGFYQINDFSMFIDIIEQNLEFFTSEDYQDNPISQRELTKAGWDPKKNQYMGSKWSLYLRIPRILHKIFSTQPNSFIQLKNIAQVRSGIKSGANEFFYLTKEQLEEHQIEAEYWHHTAHNGEDRPNWIIKSPRECNAIRIEPSDLKLIVLNIAKSKGELTGTHVGKYIENAEKNNVHINRTCASRKLWYSLNLPAPKKILWEMIHFARLKAPYNPESIYIDHNFFELNPIDTKNDLILVGLLNSTYMALIRELWGRFNLGDGSIKTEKIDIERFPLISPALFTPQIQSRFEQAVNVFLNRSKTESIINELGINPKYPKREQIQLEKIWNDRREIDKILFTELLQLSDEEQIELYQAVLDLVSTRLKKSISII